jgi:transposase InsO family protein
VIYVSADHINAITYMTRCIINHDCSRKVASKWSERKRSVDVLNVLEDWIIINGKPKKIMHDNGKHFTSKMFRHLLIHNQILKYTGNNIQDSRFKIQGEKISHSFALDIKF